jgi:hypothetical protein
MMVRSAFRDCTCVDLSSRYSKQKHAWPKWAADLGPKGNSRVLRVGDDEEAR